MDGASRDGVQSYKRTFRYHSRLGRVLLQPRAHRSRSAAHGWDCCRHMSRDRAPLGDADACVRQSYGYVNACPSYYVGYDYCCAARCEQRARCVGRVVGGRPCGRSPAVGIGGGLPHKSDRVSLAALKCRSSTQRREKCIKSDSKVSHHRVVLTKAVFASS